MYADVTRAPLLSAAGAVAAEAVTNKEKRSGSRYGAAWAGDDGPSMSTTWELENASWFVGVRLAS